MKDREQIVREICNRTFREIDYPELSSAEEVADIELRSPDERSDALVSEHPILGTITITNQKTGYKLALFSPRMTEEQLENLASGSRVTPS